MSLLAERQKAFNDALGHAMTLRKQFDGRAENPTGLTLAEIEKAFDVADSLKKEIEDLQHEDRVAKAADNLKAWADGIPSDSRPAQQRDAGGNSDAALKAANREYMQTFNKFLQGETTKYNLQDAAKKLREVKAYQADNPTGGGFAVLSEELSNTILTLVKDKVWMRQLGGVQPPMLHADSLGVVAVDTDPSDSDWTNEISTGNEETTMATGKREMRPSPLAKLLKVSKTLVRKSPNIVDVMLDRLAYKAAIAEEKAFLTGNGANQPLGIYTADSNGISTSRDVTAASSTTIAGNDIIKTFMKCKAPYRSQGVWVLHRDVVSNVRQIKDSNGNYLWTIGAAGQSGMVTGPGGGLQGLSELLMNRPVCESEYAPNTLTTGLYVMAFGNMSYYWIVDSLEMDLQVLLEKYADTNQNGYILRKETDGQPVLEEAFSRLVLA